MQSVNNLPIGLPFDTRMESASRGRPANRTLGRGDNRPAFEGQPVAIVPAMQYEKKQIQKEDGRYLVYYHFPDTATDEQTVAFQSAEAASSAVAIHEVAASAPENPNKDKPSV